MKLVRSRRFVFPVAIFLATVRVALAAPPSPAPAITLHAAATLTNAQASQHLPVVFEATVTYYRSYDKDLFVQDGNDAIYVHATTKLKLTPGDRVLLRGTTHESFRPYVNSRDITVIGHGALPKSIQPNFEQMIRAEADCNLVTVHALVRSADLVPDTRSPIPAGYLRMIVDGGPVDANVDTEDEATLKNLLDAEVEITGAISGHFDNKMQMTGVLLHVQSLDGIRILKPASSDPWSVPVTPMDRIITGYRLNDFSERTHVRGTITYYQPGRALVLQDGSRSLWINTESWNPLHVGDVADVIGFPTVDNGFLTLNRGEVRDSLVQAPVSPALFTWRDLALGGNDGHSRVFDLVSVEGQVVTEVRQATQDLYVLESDGHLFSVILSHSALQGSTRVPPLKDVPLGARIRVTGICILADANPFNGEVPFNILIRDFDDIVIVAQPPWLNIGHLIAIASILLAMVIALGFRAWYLER